MLSQRSQIQKVSTVWFHVYKVQDQAKLHYVSLEGILTGRVNEEASGMLVIFRFLIWVLGLLICSFCGSSLSSTFIISPLFVCMYVSLKCLP